MDITGLAGAPASPTASLTSCRDAKTRESSVDRRRASHASSCTASRPACCAASVPRNGSAVCCYALQQLKTLHLNVMALCLSVCLSIASRSNLSKRMNESSWFGMEASSTYPILCYKEMWVSRKIRALPSGTLSQAPDLKYFASAYRSSKHVIDLA